MLAWPSRSLTHLRMDAGGQRQGGMGVAEVVEPDAGKAGAGDVGLEHGREPVRVDGRMQHHEATRAYVARRTAEGRTKAEIIRCLKRFVAREIWALMRPLCVGRCGSVAIPSGIGWRVCSHPLPTSGATCSSSLGSLKKPPRPPAPEHSPFGPLTGQPSPRRQGAFLSSAIHVKLGQAVRDWEPSPAG
jgi:hypothetical protein